ncbi:helix-turn-helix domain-containing protein [Pseudaminobacter soli (ex Li et al. 2025)]|uniref:Transcriptional regulator n=1 Tax=Pseudaminobacter soli (ex Li et al. 2025) TaxID=1295366 RepID=A0A2P7S6N0_9HYPH|nr:helix-turn-helix domain-containing protein [Mesorhizobium soli]PSJ58134.1 transcriptional regulator [Mesorhizobium soli]
MVEEPDFAENPEWDESNSRAPDAAAKLKAARAALLMSQSDFAKLLGIPLATLQNWEQRRTQPDAVANTLIDLIIDDPQEMRRRMERRSAA